MAPYTPERVVVAGDWHANAAWAFGVIRQLPDLLPNEQKRIILHAGDFGVMPNSDAYLYKLSFLLGLAGAEIWFVDGNHEDHARLAIAKRETDGRARIIERVWWLPRGYRWTWHKQTWLALGGAVSLDREWRTPLREWWPQEEISDAQAAMVIDGGPAEVMLTHDCPSGVQHTFPPRGWPPADLDRTDLHRDRLQRVVDQVQPLWLIHGHLHHAYQRDVPMGFGRVEVTGLDCDGKSGNWRILNVRTMEWET